MNKKLKIYMENKILIDKDIKRLIKQKKDWLIKNPLKKQIPKQFNLGNWNQFLPPVNLNNMKKATNISSDFKNLLNNDIKNGSYNQFSRLWDLKGKIRKFSLMIQESIQSVINNQPLLLNTIDEIPFVENACCHDGMNSVFKYFVEKDNNIFKYNKILHNLEDIYNKYNNIHKPPMIYSQENTKIIFPELSKEFTEETIYLFFIKHCKFNSGQKLPQEILEICMKNTSEINKNMSLEEKIDILKKEGNIYTNDSLYQLLSIVHNKNSIELDINEKNISPRQEFEDFINYLNRVDNKIINNELLDFFNKIFDRYEVYYEKDDDLIINFNKYLTDENDILIKNILNFTQQYSTIKNIKSFLNNINQWKEIDSEYMFQDDSTGFHIYRIMKEFIININKQFPINIINSRSMKIKIPSHWNITSERHRNDISHIIESEFKEFAQFKNNKNLNDLLNNIKQNNENLIKFIELIPFFSKDKINNINIKTIIDGDTLKNLSIHVFLISINTYISIFDSFDFFEEEFYENKNEENEYILGEKEQLKITVTNLLKVYFNYFTSYKKMLNVSNEDIYKKILKGKEKEKERKKDSLKNLNDESREIENILKQHKLGEWGLGLTSAVFKYSSTQYDKERQEMEDIAFEEYKLGITDDITQENREIYKMDFLEESNIETRINNEVYSISHLPEDDDMGDNDDIDYT